VRQLGIPTVVDRVFQQTIHQVLESYVEPGFSANSFGFRPNKSAHQLPINTQKSGVDKVWKRTFLGFTFTRKGGIMCSDESVGRFKATIRRKTRRNRGINIDRLIFELNKVILGWGNYFKVANAQSNMKRLDGYIRRKLRCFRIKQIPRGKPMYRFLKKMGVSGQLARNICRSGKDWWCLSNTKAVQYALNNQWFHEQGLLTFQRLLAR